MTVAGRRPVQSLTRGMTRDPMAPPMPQADSRFPACGMVSP